MIVSILFGRAPPFLIEGIAQLGDYQVCCVEDVTI